LQERAFACCRWRRDVGTWYILIRVARARVRAFLMPTLCLLLGPRPHTPRRPQFAELLKAAGANIDRISDMMSLFNQADKDGSGTLTIDEIKTLGDGNRNKVSPTSFVWEASHMPCQWGSERVGIYFGPGAASAPPNPSRDYAPDPALPHTALRTPRSRLVLTLAPHMILTSDRCA
jgi:hypothetical protein